MKKTNWITIPDEKSHVSTPSPSPASQPEASHQVQNKILWSIGFVALVIIAFAALAPNEFNSLIKGSLFDAQGDPEQKIEFNLLPTQKQGNTPFDGATNETDSGADEAPQKEAENSAPSASPATGNVIQPEAEAVNISIDPIGPKDCGSDINCFLENLKTCQPAKATGDLSINAKPATVVLEITGAENGACKVNVGFAGGPDISLEGKEATCQLSASDHSTEKNLGDTLSDPDRFQQYCTGEAVALMKQYFESLEAKATANEQAKIIDALNAQLQALKDQQNQANLRGVAPDGLNSSVQSNQLIGEPPAQTPGFRANPYRVNLTPQQVLQQNLAGGVTAQPASPQNNYPPSGGSNTYNGSLSGGKTPETGPAETLLAVIAITYLGTMFWEWRRKKKYS